MSSYFPSELPPRPAPRSSTVELLGRWLPYVVAALALAYIISAVPLPKEPLSKTGEKYDLNEVGRLQILVDGRFKPVDSVARFALVAMSGRQLYTDKPAPGTTENAEGTTETRTLLPAEWLLNVLARPSVANNYKIFRINNPDILGLFGWQQQTGVKYFSFNDLKPFLKQIDDENAKVQEIRRKAQAEGRQPSEVDLKPFQRDVENLYKVLYLYQQLKNSIMPEDSPGFKRELEAYVQILPAGLEAAAAKKQGQPFDEKAFNALMQFIARFDSLAQTSKLNVAWPVDGVTSEEHWRSVGTSLTEDTPVLNKVHPAVEGWTTVLEAWKQQNAASFNGEVIKMMSITGAKFPNIAHKCDLEQRFNNFAPFYLCMALYTFAFLLAACSWMGFSEPLRRSAVLLLFLTLIVHTAGLVIRIYLQGRPPVTNLYSSAIFIGWAAILLGMFIELTSRDGIGAAASALIGFTTLSIAHFLSLEGDTMIMLQAVLDTNFWLATHVVTVTIGYSATFLAGLLAVFYIIRGVFTKTLDVPARKRMGGMMYGVICFATLFSFVGTVLGGIWADQSWGRFWGWDPKENGALMIVLWNAMILHARWGGLIRERGMAVLAVAGNIITSFSWFGVNMLGIGLHSYGFMDSALFWLVAFDCTQLAIIFIGMFPFEAWRSYEAELGIGRGPGVPRGSGNGLSPKPVNATSADEEKSEAVVYEK
ncbi:MAG: cytochrome c biogenesis protein [Candidatus Methylacidiphilales bacterium]|nr:cytochrome c biogenesis protein CcsA [Candidatus Methylacidiphilales bacterium]